MESSCLSQFALVISVSRNEVAKTVQNLNLDLHSYYINLITITLIFF